MTTIELQSEIILEGSACWGFDALSIFFSGLFSSVAETQLR